MSDQLKMDLPVCPPLKAWSVSTLHVAQAAAAQTEETTEAFIRHTDPTAKRAEFASPTLLLLAPLSRGPEVETKKRQKGQVAESSQLPKIKRSEPHL